MSTSNNTAPTSEKTSSEGFDITHLLYILLVLLIPRSFKFAGDIFNSNLAVEASLTLFTCFVNYISIILFVKNNLKMPIYKSIWKFVHRLFVFTNVIVSTFEISLFIGLWFSSSENLSLYSYKEAQMTPIDQFLVFLIIRLLPLLCSLYIFYKSDERLSKISFFSALGVFPLYFCILKSKFNEFGVYPHSFLESISHSDLIRLAVLLSLASLIFLFILDLIKAIQVNNRKSNLSETPNLEKVDITVFILNTVYSFFSNYANKI
jgi:hypothetical protein